MRRISKCQLWRLLKEYWASSNLMLQAAPMTASEIPLLLLALADEVIE